MKITKLYVVRDATPDSELVDIYWETTVERLPEYILGTGAAMWRQEHTTFYTSDAEAKRDAAVRLARAKGKTAAIKTAVIREEDGKFCVRSPDNADWNGGCYDTKEEAEKRLQAVEYFKRQADLRDLRWKAGLTEHVRPT